MLNTVVYIVGEAIIMAVTLSNPLTAIFYRHRIPTKSTVILSTAIIIATHTTSSAMVTYIAPYSGTALGE